MIANFLLYASLCVLLPQSQSDRIGWLYDYINHQNTVENMQRISDISEDDKHWLALNIYHEARNQNTYGKMAVAFVTMNRVVHPSYPNNIKDVVQQHKQFSWFSDGKSDTPTDDKAWQESKMVADLCIGLYNDMAEIEDGDDYLVKGATHYHADYVDPYWNDSMKKISKINNHIFYK